MPLADGSFADLDSVSVVGKEQQQIAYPSRSSVRPEIYSGAGAVASDQFNISAAAKGPYHNRKGILHPAVYANNPHLEAQIPVRNASVRPDLSKIEANLRQPLV